MDTYRKHARNEEQSSLRAAPLGPPLGDLAHRLWFGRPLSQGNVEPTGSMHVMFGGDLHSDGPLVATCVRCGDLEIDRIQRRAVLAGSVLRLTGREFALLLCLVDHANRVVRRSDLLEQIWSLRDAHGSNVVNVYIRRLRRKFGAYAGMIRTIRGFGYCLRSPLGT